MFIHYNLIHRTRRACLKNQLIRIHLKCIERHTPGRCDIKSGGEDAVVYVSGVYLSNVQAEKHRVADIVTGIRFNITASNEKAATTFVGNHNASWFELFIVLLRSRKIFVHIRCVL